MRHCASLSTSIIMRRGVPWASGARACAFRPTELLFIYFLIESVTESTPPAPLRVIGRF